MSAKKGKKKQAFTFKKNKSNFILVLAILAAFSVGLYLFVANMIPSNKMMTAEEEASSMMVKKVINPVVVLNEQNKSGEYGNATIYENNGKVVVKINVKNAPRGVSQPAHLHTGSCVALGGVVYPLNNVVNGVSTTTLNVTLDQLKGKLPLALNVHKSNSQSNLYVSCGNVELQ